MVQFGARPVLAVHPETQTSNLAHDRSVKAQNGSFQSRITALNECCTVSEILLAACANLGSLFAARTAKRAAITKRIGWHTFRRSLATLLTSMKGTVKVAQGLLRHADPRITVGLYAQEEEEAKRAAQEHVSGLFLVQKKASRFLVQKTRKPAEPIGGFFNCGKLKRELVSLVCPYRAPM